MERVTFLIEQTGEQLACLLNPESLVIRRTAGVRVRESSSGQLTGPGQTDQPLLFTGGGLMEVELDLLFDVSLAGSSPTPRNVRDLTGPLWRMAENQDDTGYGRPPRVRFIWGKTFNLPGVVAGVAERLERFSREGLPSRSWLRMRIVRIDEDERDANRSQSSPSPASLMEAAAATRPGEGSMHTLSGGLPMMESGSGAAFATTFDIAGRGFDRSGAAGLLSAAQSALSRTGTVLAGGEGRLEEEEPSAQEQLRAASEAFGRALEGAASGVKAGDLGRVRTAVEQMAVAADSAADAAGAFVSEGGRAAARDIRGALDAVGPAAEDLLTAAHRVAREVVQTSARALGAAVAGADRMIGRVSVTAEQLVASASRAQRQAGTALQEGLDTVAGVLDRIRTSGAFADVALLPEALQEIGRATDLLWAAGAGKAADRVHAMVEHMAVTVKNMKAAGQAARTVLESSLSGMLQSMTESLEAAVEAARTSDDFTGVRALRPQLRAVTRIVSDAEPAADAEAQRQVREAVEPLEAIVERVLESRAPRLLGEIDDLLPAVEAAAAALEAAEQKDAAEAVTAAVRVSEEAEAAGPGGADAGTMEAGGQGYQGERLDQIAFRRYGRPAYWRLLALHNDIDHPLRLHAGRQLSIPPAP